jgi:GNAT superfamily N-acetyltransferase
VRIERIDVGRHDWSDFGCGDPVLDGWLRDAAAADRQPGVLVQVATDGRRVVGCYRLGSFQVEPRRPVTSIGSRRAERMPVSAIVVSRLGVDQRWQQRGLGGWLMCHALEVAAAVGPAVGARLVVAHREAKSAPGFVARFGFRAFDRDPRFSYLPMRDLQVTISAPAAPPHSTAGMDGPAPDR